MPGAQCTRSLVCDEKQTHERSHHRSTGTPGIPARNGFTAYFALSPVTRLCCHRHQRIMVLSDTRSGRLASANLTPTLGRQNHTTSPSASAPFVCAPFDRSRKPALRSLRARGRCRVHRIPCPTSVTIAKRPSVGRDVGSYGSDLGQAGNKLFLQSHIDEALVYSRGCQPLILVALHGAAMTAGRAARDLPVLTPARRRFPRAGELHWVTLGVQSDRRKPERCSEDVS
jgi:hypothetical protein